jgi:hypothetical protein
LKVHATGAGMIMIKVRARKQRTDIVKYCFVKRTNCGINFDCKSHIVRKRVRKLI